MRKVLFPLAFVTATTAVACSFQMKAGSDPNNPSNTPPPQSTPANTPGQTAANPAAGATGKTLNKRKLPQPKPTTTSTAAPTPTTTTPGGGAAPPPGVLVVNGPTPFGSGNPSASGWKGSISKIPAGSTKLPAMASQQTIGYVYLNELNIGVRPFTEGFPGIDANLKENFAIRYEAPLVVSTEDDYEFKLAADDGAVLLIDGTPIVDNDGKHDFKDVTGPVHLVTGTHVMTVDYFQTTGNVGLQLFCKKMGDATDKVCGNTL
jgi:hypothetical protein